MKGQSAAPKRYIQEGLLIYSSGTLHHQRNSVRGYLVKQAETVKLFQKHQTYKRYFIADARQSFVQI